jgi:hypothetical protein
VKAEEATGEYELIHRVMDSVCASTARKPGDPNKAALLFVELANNPDPPRRLFLGKMASDIASAKTELIAQTVARWRDRSAATDFDP